MSHMSYSSTKQYMFSSTPAVTNMSPHTFTLPHTSYIQYRTRQLRHLCLVCIKIAGADSRKTARTYFDQLVKKHCRVNLSCTCRKPPVLSNDAKRVVCMCSVSVWVSDCNRGNHTWCHWTHAHMLPIMHLCSLHLCAEFWYICVLYSHRDFMMFHLS